MNIQQARQAALDENTKPFVLDKLANSHDSRVRQYTAKNPNTAVETLLELGNEFPEEIITNPVFNLLLLENPQSEFVQISLFRSTTTPLDVLEKMVKREFFLFKNIIENQKVDPEILDRLADINNNWRFLPLCHSILRSKKTSTKTLEKIASSRFVKHLPVKNLLLGHPNVDETVIKIVESIYS